MKFLEFIFSGFWIWLGFVIILYVLTNAIYHFYTRTLRHLNIRKHGYPKNADADGDLCCNSKYEQE